MKNFFYFQRILIGIGLCISVSLQAQVVVPVFEDATPEGAPQVFRGNGAWGDYNNDGLIDLVVMGRTSKEFKLYLTLYTNNGNGFSLSNPISLPQEVYNTVLTWIDYNNDGNLDLLLVGSTVNGDKDSEAGKEDVVFAKLYKNNGSESDFSFSEVENCGIKGIFFGQERIYASTVSVGDYNNDGYSDVAFTGNRGGNKIEVYTNNNGNGTFTLLENPVNGKPFASMNSGTLAWGDYDGDGFQDLLVSGWMNDQTNLKLYRNKGDGTFEEILSQTDTEGPYKGQIGWLDANGDGNLDFIVTGETKAAGKDKDWGKTTDIYLQNMIGNERVFTKLANSNLPYMLRSSIDYADLNNDGFLDILMSGENNGLAKTSIAMKKDDAYELTTATGNKVTNGFEGFKSGTSLSLYDYDNDGYLDFFVMGYNADGAKLKIYHNTGNDITKNTSPEIPSGLVLTPKEGKTIFSWNASSDTETPATALRYNIYVKKKDGEVGLLIPADINTGKLKVADCTLATMQTSYTLNIPASEIAEWGVQAIDQGKMPSKFAKQSVLYRECYIDGGWETICLPFNVTKITDEAGEELPKDDYTLKELTGAEDGVLYYSKVGDGMMRANIPYILSLRKGESQSKKKLYLLYGEETMAGTTPSVEFGGYAFTGTYIEKNGAEGLYVLNADGSAFVKGIPSTIIPAYCAYITSPTGSLKSIRISDSGATAIENTDMRQLKIFVENGLIKLISPQADTIKIYSIDGCLIRSVEVREGTNYIDGLSQGVYLISNNKVVVKR